MFRIALSDLLRLRQAKADPEQPCIPVPQFVPFVQSFCIDPTILPVLTSIPRSWSPPRASQPQFDPPAAPQEPTPEPTPEPSQPQAAPAPEPEPVPDPQAETAFDEPPMIPERDQTGAIHLNMADDPIMMPIPRKPVPHYDASHFPNERFNTKLVPLDCRFTADGWLRNEPNPDLSPCPPIRSKPS
jgi:hypothetical protein